MQMKSTASRIILSAILLATTAARAFSQMTVGTSSGDASGRDDVSLLKQQIAEQQKQIERLISVVNEMKRRMDQTDPNSQSASVQTPNLGQVASVAPIIPATPKGGEAAAPLMSVPSTAAPVVQEQAQGYNQKVETMSKTVDALSKGLAGFKFSGDFRYRFDAAWRSANSVGASQQNVRERYRLRFNVDKPISNQFDAHFQLGSGTFNNPLTFDTDFAGVNNRGPLFITEWWGAYHPNKYLDLRGGKMPEVFADSSRFFFDDDLRLNGFQETGKVPLEKNGLGVKSIEFKAAQYILTNPNVQVLPSAKQCTATPPTITITQLGVPVPVPQPSTLPAACAYLSAGFPQGGKVRDTNLFDQGVVFAGEFKERWSHQFATDIQLWRNPNALQLASLASGFPLLVNGYYGVQVSSGPPGTGTATTTKGGAIFTAASFEVGRINYRLTHVGWKTSRQNVPVWLDLQASRNFGVGFARNAWTGTLSVGEVKKLGDVRFLYQYAYKDANSMIAQLTDDDLGTGTGVNIRTHGIRVDLGLNRFLEWDNKLWIQDPVRGNDAARNLFVPVPAGVNTAYRVQSEFNVKF